jgi:hypothetical protein
MSDTLLRQWELLRSIPRAPRKIDAGTLLAKLETAGYRQSRQCPKEAGELCPSGPPRDAAATRILLILLVAQFRRNPSGLH